MALAFALLPPLSGGNRHACMLRHLSLPVSRRNLSMSRLFGPTLLPSATRGLLELRFVVACVLCVNTLSPHYFPTMNDVRRAELKLTVGVVVFNVV